MPSVNPEQWAEWKRNNVTEAVMLQVQDRIEEAKELLCGVGNDRDFDQYIKGMIRAFSEVLDVQLEIEEEEDEIQTGDTGPSSNY